MKGFSVLVSATLAAGAQASGPVVFYSGDLDGYNGAGDEINTAVADSRIYEGFDLRSASVIGGVFANCLTFLQTNEAHYEIRSGIAEGNGGTLLAGGDIAVVETFVERRGFGFPVYDFAGKIPSLRLEAGHYYVSLAPIGKGSGRAFICTTSGANGVNQGTLTGDSYWDSATFGFNFTRTSNVLGAPLDFSIGLRSPVPEPAPGAAMAVGALALARRRRSH